MKADDVRVHQQSVIQYLAVHVDVDLQLHQTMAQCAWRQHLRERLHCRAASFRTMPPRSMNLPATSSPVRWLRKSIVTP